MPDFLTTIYIIFQYILPQYISQWAEINSERLVNPVFRLFQSELETVYEERTCIGDTMASVAIEKLTELFLSASVCVSDYRKCGELEESRLSEMRWFFEVPPSLPNMGLILSDF